MPVFVTHADTPVGVDLVRALADDGADVRAFATGAGDVAAVRAAGAIVAVGDHDDEGHLEAAMTHAHTVVVPTIGWLTSAMEVERDWPVVVTAAEQAHVTRIVMVSLVGAGPDADVPVLAALGAMEERLGHATAQTLVVRTDGVVEDGHADVAAALRGVDDCRGAVMAPVARADLVAGLVALDAARSGRTGGHALFTALGPLVRVDGQADARAGEGSEAQVEATAEATGGTSLVGRRWMPPARREALVRAICGRPAPAVAGADLWELAG